MTTVLTGAEPQALGAGDQDLAAGDTVGEFRVEAAIGRGGFGTVYRAIQPVIGKQVAIKVLARRYSADPDIVSRFVAEARAVNQIRHRNIIDIFSFGQLADGRHYYVMELLEGATLAHLIIADGPMAIPQALVILRAIARALDAAHAKGIAHRDLKPENIFVSTDGEGAPFPKLLDFGIAKLLAPADEVRHHTGTGVPLGTPYYMSPEQCRGRDIDHRTDIYSFGVLVFRMLTARYPFEGDYLELLSKQVNEPPPPPSSLRPELDARIDAAVAWMMQKLPADRPASLIEAVGALDPDAVTPNLPAMHERPASSASAPPDPYALTVMSVSQVGPVAHRPRWIAPAIVVAIAALGLGVFAATRMSDPPAVVIAPPVVPAPAPVPVPTPVPPPVAPPAPPPPIHVTFNKVPARTRAVVGDREFPLPGEIAIARGERAIEIVLSAPGYRTRSITVVPDGDRTMGTRLERDPAGRPPPATAPPVAPVVPPPPPPPRHDDHDAIHSDEIFGKGSGR